MALTAPTMSRPVGVAPVELDQPAPEPGERGTERAGVLLLGALLAAVLYAIFAHGAAPQPEEARLQVGLSLVAVAALAALLWGSGLRVAAPAAAWAGLGLLAAFAAWSGLSMAWTVFPSATWTELNRAIAYALVVGLALAAGSWYPRAVSRAALGYLAIALIVALYALLAKVVPAVHIGGLVDFDKTTVIARLREPLEYWNALALVLAMAVPIVLRLAVDETRTPRARVGALALAPIFLVTIGLTYSRGGVIAVAVAVLVTMLAGGSRLRTLLYLALALAASVPALWFGLTAEDLTHNLVSLSAREDDGLVLGLLVIGPIALLAVVGRLAMLVEARTPPSPARSRRIGQALAGVIALAALAGLLAMATSDRGLTGSVSHAWDDFRSPRGNPGLFEPGRLASTNAGNRWVWWSEAAGAWSDRPLEGWGAGSFPVTHREYRTNQLDVLQPHSVPLQFLAETGLVGFVLAMGGLVLLLVWRRRRGPAARSRGPSAASRPRSSARRRRGSSTCSTTGTGTCPGSRCPRLCSWGCCAPEPERGAGEDGRRPGCVRRPGRRCSSAAPSSSPRSPCPRRSPRGRRRRPRARSRPSSAMPRRTSFARPRPTPTSRPASIPSPTSRSSRRPPWPTGAVAACRRAST